MIKMNYIEKSKKRIEELKLELEREPENEDLLYELSVLQCNLYEMEGYQTLEDLGIEY